MTLIETWFLTARFLTLATNATSEGISSKDIVTWTISLLSATVAAIGLFYAATAFKRDSNARYAETLSKVEKDVSDVENDPNRTPPKDAPNRDVTRANWERAFLNLLNRIAYLIEHGLYTKDFAEYFQLDFRWAKYLIEKGADPVEYKKDFPETLKLCERMGWVGVDRG